MKALITPAIVVAILGIAGYFGWSWWQKHMLLADTGEQVYQTAQVERRTIAQTVDIAGDISPVEQVEVKSEVSAKIKTLQVRLGQVVKSGELLLELDDQELLTEFASVKIEIEGARLEAIKAREDHERDKQLFDRQLIAEKNLVDSRIAMELAENRLERAQARQRNVEDRLSKTRILAPMPGLVLELPVVDGQVVVAAASVNSGTMIMKIANMERLLITTHINQVDVARLSEGMEVDFTVDSVPDVAMRARIRQIAPMASVVRNVKGFTVELLIDQPDERLKPGMTADVVIPLSVSENVLSVPLAAVFSEGRQRVAFVSNGPGQPPVRREIEVGISNLDHVEIKSGLNDGETVLLTRPTPTAGS